MLTIANRSGDRSSGVPRRRIFDYTKVTLSASSLFLLHFSRHRPRRVLHNLSTLLESFLSSSILCPSFRYRLSIVTADAYTQEINSVCTLQKRGRITTDSENAPNPPLYSHRSTNFCEIGRVCKSNDRYKRVSIVVFDSEGFIHTRFFGNSTSLIILRITKAFKECFRAHKLLGTWQIWSRNCTRIALTNCTQTGGVRFN